MLIYALVIFSSICLSLVASALHQDRRILYVGCFVLTLFSALRGYVGTDTYTYHLSYISYSEISSDWLYAISLEPFFFALIKALSWASDLLSIPSNLQPFIFVSSMSVISGFLLYQILKRIRHPDLFFLFYAATFYINFNFNIIRAAIATLLCCLSILLIMNQGERRAGSGLLALTPLAHYSFFLIAPFVFAWAQISARKYSAVLFFAIFAATMAILLTYYFPVDLIVEFASIKYNYYFKESNNSIGAGFLLNILLLFFIVVLSLSKGRPLEFWLFAVPVILLRITAVWLPFIDRILVSLYPLLILFVCQSSLNGVRKIVTPLFLLISVMNGISSVLALPNSDTQGSDLNYKMSPYIPYKTFFSDLDSLS